MAAFRLLALVTALILLVSPFGRMAVAAPQAETSVSLGHHGMTAMVGHCEEDPVDRGSNSNTIDCMIACATIIPGDPARLDTTDPERVAPVAVLPRSSTGLRLGADPPPPRLS